MGKGIKGKRNSSIPRDVIKKKSNMVLVEVPRGGHIEYFTTINAKRWTDWVTVDYLKYMHQKFMDQAVKA